MAHILLFGDSIFDNGSYVEAGGATIDELAARLPEGWSATLLAIDGSVTSGIAAQLRKVPQSATHLVISTGGNDALMQQALLSEPVRSVGEAMSKFGGPVQQFEREYRAMLNAVATKGLPTVVCTVYNGNFPDPKERVVMSLALTPFNDVIIRAAWAARMPILDLRTVCDRPEHYANEIEPSKAGSARIAEAILGMISA